MRPAMTFRMPVLVLALFACNSLLADPRSLRVKACIESTPEDVVLRFELKNTSGMAISIEANSLPWIWPSSDTFRVTDVTTQRELERVAPIADAPPPLNIIVPPATYVGGNISLTAYYPTLRHSNVRHDLAVAWSLTPKVLDAPSVPASGRITLSRGTLNRTSYICALSGQYDVRHTLPSRPPANQIPGRAFVWTNGDASCTCGQRPSRDGLSSSGNGQRVQHL